MNIINKLLFEISNGLNISETMYKKAVDSYGAVGKYISSNLEIPDNDIEIYPQGSFNLGTVVRPLHDEDDGYDIDLVVELNKDKFDAKTTKIIIGDVLMNNKLYAKSLTEGKRCWTLEYSGFHMDILPSLSDSANFDNNMIKITHKCELNNYSFKKSNPKDYKKWFDDINEESYSLLANEYSKRKQLSIEEVPSYKIRTNLQRAIQLLKRHRDVMFKDKDDAPISIIITTLAAKAFGNEEELLDSLINIITRIESLIEHKNGVPSITNPSNEDENFADKWAHDNNKEENFYKWIKQLKLDFIVMPDKLSGINEIAEHFGNILGEDLSKSASIRVAEKLSIERKNDSLYVDKDSKLISKDKKGLPLKDHTFFGGNN